MTLPVTPETIGQVTKAVLYGLDALGDAQSVRVNDVGALEIITTVHGHTHEGVAYAASHIFIGVASSGSAYLEITTGATKEIHCAFEAVSSAGGRLLVYENPTTTTGVNTVAILNNNRNSTNTAEPTIVHTPTGISGGTLLPVGGVIPGGGSFFGSGGSGGELARGPELILKASTKYLVQYINDAGGAEDVSLHVGFYEE